MGDIRMLEGMRYAKAEPCYDTICERCLVGPAQKIIKPKDFNCRSCKKPIPPPKPPHLCYKGGDIQTTIVLKSILDKLKMFEGQEKKRTVQDTRILQQSILEDEDEDDAELKYIPANLYGCHKKNDKHLCLCHPDTEVDGFCSDCGLLTCSDCAIDGHEGCSNLVSIREAIAFQKQNMSNAGKEKRREMSQFGLKTQFSVGLIKNEIENFTRQTEKAKKEIHLQVQRLIHQIHEEEAKFLNQVDKCYNEETIKLEALKEIFDTFHHCGEVFMPVVQKEQDVTMEYLVKVDLFSRTMLQYNKVTDPQIPSLEFQPCTPQQIHLGVMTIYHDHFDELSNVLD